MNLINVTPNKEKVKSILEMVELIEERIKNQTKLKFASLIISDYYEILKQLMTAFLLLDGYKTLSHIDLMDYLKEKCKDIKKDEIYTINRLRIFRNRISYEGFKILPNFLTNNESDWIKLIKKLKFLINNKLKEKKK